MSDNHRLVVNFKRKSDMEAWAKFFEKDAKQNEIISVERRSRREMEA